MTAHSHTTDNDALEGLDILRLIKRSLYRLPEVTQAVSVDHSVVICATEHEADALWSIGYPATTSIGGLSAIHKTDWSPLYGAIYLMGFGRGADSDEYLDAVRDILREGARR